MGVDALNRARRRSRRMKHNTCICKCALYVRPLYLVPGVFVAIGVDGGEDVPLVGSDDVVLRALEDLLDEVGGTGRSDPFPSVYACHHQKSSNKDKRITLTVIVIKLACVDSSCG